MAECTGFAVHLMRASFISSAPSCVANALGTRATILLVAPGKAKTERGSREAKH